MAIALALALAATAQPAGPSAVRIVGYNDMRPMLEAAVARTSRASAIAFTLDLRGTRTGPPALIAGDADLAPMGAAMDPAARDAIRQRWGCAPLELRVAHDSLAPAALSSPTGVLVPLASPLRAITTSRLRQLFVEGEVRTWKDLGSTGPQAEHRIHLYGLAADTAIGTYLLGGPLHATAFSSDYRSFRQSRDVAAALAADPDGIGLANLNHAHGGVRALDLIDRQGRRHRPTRTEIRWGDYPFDRYLLVYARRDRDGRLPAGSRALLDLLLSRAGQRIVAAAPLGYIPLSRRELALERRKLSAPGCVEQSDPNPPPL